MNRVALPAHLKSRVLEATRAEPSVNRPTVTRNATMILATSLAVSVNVFLAAGGMKDDPRPRQLVVGTLLGWLSLAISSSWGALGRGGEMEGRPRRHLVALATAIPAAASVWMGMWMARYHGVAASLPMADDGACFLLALGLSAPAFLALAWVRRDIDVKHPRATGAALGAAAGAWGSTFLDAHCPSLDVVHVALGHVLPIIVLALLGTLFGRRVVRARSKASTLSV